MLPSACPEAVEREAQRIAAQLVGRSADGAAGLPGGGMHSMDVGSLEMVRPRSVGVEHVGLWAMEQLGLDEFWNGWASTVPLRVAAMASIIARMAAPGSERATWHWLCERSALGELPGTDFETMSMMRLYRAVGMP